MTLPIEKQVREYPKLLCEICKIEYEGEEEKNPEWVDGMLVDFKVKLCQRCSNCPHEIKI